MKISILQETIQIWIYKIITYLTLPMGLFLNIYVCACVCVCEISIVLDKDLHK